MTPEERVAAGVCLTVTDMQAATLLRMREVLDQPRARFTPQRRRDGSRAVVSATGAMLANLDVAGFPVEWHAGDGWRRVEREYAPGAEVR